MDVEQPFQMYAVIGRSKTRALLLIAASHFYRVSSSALQNNMLPHCSFMMSYVSEVCKVFFFSFFVKALHESEQLPALKM